MRRLRYVLTAPILFLILWRCSLPRAPSAMRYSREVEHTPPGHPMGLISAVMALGEHAMGLRGPVQCRRRGFSGAGDWRRCWISSAGSGRMVGWACAVAGAAHRSLARWGFPRRSGAGCRGRSGAGADRRAVIGFPSIAISSTRRDRDRGQQLGLGDPSAGLACRCCCPWLVGGAVRRRRRLGQGVALGLRGSTIWPSPRWASARSSSP